MAKKVTIDHMPEATFLYVVNLSNAGQAFDDDTDIEAWVEIPVGGGCNVRKVEASTSWVGRCYTRLQVDAGVLGRVSTATLHIHLNNFGTVYTCEPISINMVG